MRILNSLCSLSKDQTSFTYINENRHSLLELHLSAGLLAHTRNLLGTVHALQCGSGITLQGNVIRSRLLTDRWSETATPSFCQTSHTQNKRLPK